MIIIVMETSHFSKGINKRMITLFLRQVKGKVLAINALLHF
jgi:hypothetical protein